MRYTLVIDGQEFPGQQQYSSVPAHQVASAFANLITEGGIGYLPGGAHNEATLVHWGRVRTVKVIVEKE